jgi:hypothetical protein
MAGKHVARRREERQQDAYAQGYEQAGDEQQGAYEQDAAYEEPAPAGTGAMSQEQMDSLRELAKLKEEGILTDDEFQAQKEKILQGG